MKNTREFETGKGTGEEYVHNGGVGQPKCRLGFMCRKVREVLELSFWVLFGRFAEFM